MVPNSLLEDLTSNKKMLICRVAGKPTCLPGQITHPRVPPNSHPTDPGLAINQEVKGEETSEALFPFFGSKEEFA